MKKLLYTGILLLVFLHESKAQQLPQYTQYLLNKYVINPASAGSENYFVGQTNYRNQWSGIQDAPRTYILSANGPLTHEKMGIGGYLFSDVTGPTRRNGLNLSYSYHFQLNDEINLSLSLNAGVLSYGIDGTQINFEEDGDQVASQSLEKSVYPDAGFSFYLYGPNYFFGGSAPQLLRNELNFENSISNPTGRLVNHYFIMGGYTYELNSSFDIEPSFLLKYVKPAPIQYELSARGIYEETAWLGVSYRQGDAVALLAGYTLHDNLSLGYAYDITTSNIKNYSNGTHEIMLSIRFSKDNAINTK